MTVSKKAIMDEINLLSKKQEEVHKQKLKKEIIIQGQCEQKKSEQLKKAG